MWIPSPSVSLCLFFPLLWHTVELQALKINTPNLCVCVCVCAELCLLSSQACVQQRCPGHCHSSGVFDKLLTCIKGKNSLLPSSVFPHVLHSRRSEASPPNPAGHSPRVSVVTVSSGGRGGRVSGKCSHRGFRVTSLPLWQQRCYRGPNHVFQMYVMSTVPLIVNSKTIMAFFHQSKIQHYQAAWQST